MTVWQDLAYTHTQTDQHTMEHQLVIRKQTKRTAEPPPHRRHLGWHSVQITTHQNCRTRRPPSTAWPPAAHRPRRRRAHLVRHRHQRSRHRLQGLPAPQRAPPLQAAARRAARPPAGTCRRRRARRAGRRWARRRRRRRRPGWRTMRRPPRSRSAVPPLSPTAQPRPPNRLPNPFLNI